MKTVSIIVPVYNAEKTVTECLGNLVHQTLDGVEILLVNDASTDGSLRILQDCSAQFPDKVILIDSPENKGAGGARNLALDRATGKYIGFVDADDIVDTRMFEKLYHTAEENGYAMVDCGFIDEAHDRAIVMTGDDCTGILDDEKRSRLIVTGGYMCTRITLRDLFEKPVPLREREHRILEDSEILTYLLAVAKSIGNVKEILYKYRAFPDSISRLIEPEAYCRNAMDAMEAIFEKTHTLSNYGGIRHAVEYEILQLYSYSINVCLKAMQDRSFPGAEKKIRELVRLKNRLIRSNDYRQNPFVKEKIPNEDLQIIMDVDRKQW